ncbi:MAG: hypothetical protein Q8P18_26495 [Pseudomonadota bacterium]|nr:hypothetical protein [Pseudomonadota bacterium]
MRHSLVFATMVVSAGLAGWLAFHYVGPYKWAAEAQGAVFHTHWVQLSFLCAWVTVGAPFYLVARWADNRLGPADPGKELRWEQLEALGDGWPGKMLLVGLTIAAVTGWLGYRDAGAGPLTTVELARLEAGDAPPSLYVDLVGAYAVEEATIRFKERSSETRYVPLVAGDKIPVVFAKLGKNETVGDPVRGQLEEDGLPGEVRTAYESAGYVGPRHFVLSVGRDPAESATFAKWGVLVGLALAGVGFGVGWSRLPPARLGG